MTTIFPILRKKSYCHNFNLHPHASVPKLTKNHIKYVFICKISFKSEVFLPVHHETSHMYLHSLKIQLKVEYFAKSDFSVCEKNSHFT